MLHVQVPDLELVALLLSARRIVQVWSLAGAPGLKPGGYDGHSRVVPRD